MNETVEIWVIGEGVQVAPIVLHCWFELIHGVDWRFVCWNGQYRAKTTNKQVGKHQTGQHPQPVNKSLLEFAFVWPQINGWTNRAFELVTDISACHCKLTLVHTDGYYFDQNDHIVVACEASSATLNQVQRYRQTNNGQQQQQPQCQRERLLNKPCLWYYSRLRRPEHNVFVVKNSKVHSFCARGSLRNITQAKIGSLKVFFKLEFSIVGWKTYQVEY